VRGVTERTILTGLGSSRTPSCNVSWRQVSATFETSAATSAAFRAISATAAAVAAAEVD
jgi:hypothetical protein